MHPNASHCVDLRCARRWKMRWEQLFADLQAQFEAEEAATERADSPSRARAEVGAVELADRLRGSLGLPLTLGCGGAGTVTGTPVEVGPDWLLVEDDAARQSLVALSAVRWVSGVGRRTAAAEPLGPVRGRLDLRRAARRGGRRPGARPAPPGGGGGVGGRPGRGGGGPAGGAGGP